ncbi:MAG TPA: YqgE/AlgH family protein [Gammaproteobacteria bacterium]|nr:YqgE/AlgH family protein [Gammaproteobacteria bacterium]
MSTQRFTNQLLIAMPSLEDPNFSRTVTLICEHNEHGALGVVINRPTEVRLGALLEHLNLTAVDARIANTAVYAGGPVQLERGFILHTPLGDWESTLKIDTELGLTTSLDILAAVAAGAGPKRSLVALGYAGWGAGQLEQEIVANAWLTVPNDVEILFELPVERRWQAAARKLGVDLNLMAGDAGHA